MAQLTVTPINGMDRATGRKITGLAHLEQSITDILLTPLGSRVMRRDYGSHLYQWVDRNIQQTTVVGMMAEIADALEKWEPRFTLSRCRIDSDVTDFEAGTVGLLLAGTFNHQEVTIGITV